MSNKDSLSGKIALITGASRGIGKEIALELSRLGAEVFINYSSSDEKAEEVVNSIKNSGGKAHKLKFDESIKRYGMKKRDKTGGSMVLKSVSLM